MSIVSQDEIIIEHCVSCGDDTPYNIFDHIDSRLFFVEGSGQLCRNCYTKVYGHEKKK